MKYLLVAILSNVLTTAAVTSKVSEAQGDGKAETIWIRSITIIDASPQSPRFNQDVLIQGENIVAVTPTGAKPPGQAVILEGKDKYLVPGFVDMHVHLLEHGRNEKGEIPPRINWDWTRRALRLLLAHGVTTVRDPGSETEAAVTLRNMLQEKKVVGPRLYTAGRILNASSFNPEPFQPVQTAEQIRNEIRWQAAAGVNFIKVYSSMPPELVRVAVEEAHLHKLKVIGHLQRTTWEKGAELGIDFISHAAPWALEYLPAEKQAGYEQTLYGRVYWLENTDREALLRMARTLAANKVVVDPTLIAMHTKFFGNDSRWLNNPANKLLPAWLATGWRKGKFTADWTEQQYVAAQNSWPKLLAFAKMLFDNGVPLTVGTDSPTAWIVPGASIHEEMELLAEAGISPQHILQMATQNAHSALGWNSAGRIEPGATADLLILSGNPLEDIRNSRTIEVVLSRGLHYKPEQLLQ